MPESEAHLSRRERQIMDVIYARGEASAADVHTALPDAPSYSAVRALLRILEEKGALTHREDGPRYVFMPTVPRAKASRSAVRRLVDTFFAGSVADAVAALVTEADGKLAPDEIKRIRKMLKDAHPQ